MRCMQAARSVQQLIAIAMVMCVELGAHSSQGADAYPVGMGGVEEGVRADRAGRKVAALVCGVLGEVHAGVAVHAVAGVDAQALPHAAQIAEGAVVDVAPWLVVPQVADAAVVPRHALPAAAAAGCTARGTSEFDSSTQASCPLPTLRAAGCTEQNSRQLGPEHACLCL